MKYIAKAFNYLVGFTFMFSICAIDSDGWWATVLFIISGGYLAILALRNDLFYNPEMEEEE